MIEYGVRRYGGHIEAKVSKHVAEREVDTLIEAGEKNVWLVQRRVTGWLPAKEALVREDAGCAGVPEAHRETHLDYLLRHEGMVDDS